MKDDILIRRIYAYGLGVIFIAAWALFRFIPYDIAMMLASAVLVYCLLLEAKHMDKGFKIKQFSKLIIAILLCIGIVLLVLMKF